MEDPVWLPEEQFTNPNHKNYHPPERRWWEYNLEYWKEHFSGRTKKWVPLLDTTNPKVTDSHKADWPSMAYLEYMENPDVGTSDDETQNPKQHSTTKTVKKRAKKDW